MVIIVVGIPQLSEQLLVFDFAIKNTYTVELQWLEHLWDHEN